MKQTLAILLAVGLGFAVAALWFSRRQTTHPSRETPAQTALTETRSAPDEGGAESPPPRRAARMVAPVATEEPSVTIVRRTPQDWLNELVTIQVTPGPGQARAQYRILTLLDQLAQSGTSALPAIQQFLVGNRDVAYSGTGRNAPRNAMLPPSLRMGLFDVVRQIGGAEAEQILADSLKTTGQVGELVYLSEILREQLPSGKYRDATLNAVRALLAGGKIADASERDRLYALLIQHDDSSYIPTAQANLVQPDGKLDASVLRYLQSALGEKSIALAAQTFQDKRVVDADSREALGRLALNYVGANDQALELYHQAALDPQLKPDQRRNLVEDLNQDGLSNRRNPTPEDLKIIAKRYELTQSYLQQDYVKNDKLLNEAFLEANKDLANLLQRAGVTLPGGPPSK
jgi:hypothetical protein